MKKLLLIMSQMLVALMIANAAQPITLPMAKVSWDGVPEASSYNVYYKPTIANTWVITNVVDKTNNFTIIPITPYVTYQIYVTSLNDVGIETEPSNQVRYQLMYVNANRSTPLVLGDLSSTNFPSFILANNTTNGTLSGTPPSIVYTPNSGGVKKDTFSYKSSELYQGINITNYYVVSKLPFGPPNIKNIE